MRLRYKKWAPGLIKDNPNIAFGPEKIDSLPEFKYLEIGSGRGYFLLEKALMDTNNFYLGVEINYNAFSIAVKRALDAKYANLNNFAFLNAPIDKVFPVIKDESLETIYLNFSDPWPKKKQYKRRLTYPTKLEEYYRILKVGGTIFFKTDNLELYEASKVYFEQFGKFNVVFQDDYESLDENDVMTEFEQKFRAQGSKIYRIIAKK